MKEFENKTKTIFIELSDEPPVSIQIELPRYITTTVKDEAPSCDWLSELLRAICEAWQKDIDVLDILKSKIRLPEAVVAGEEVIIIEGTGSVVKNSREHQLLKEWLENE